MSMETSMRGLVCASMLLRAGISSAQSAEPRDAWLMKNYRFTGPPPPGEVRTVDPVVLELRRIQNVVLAVLRKADFDRDYEAALAAAAQAAGNAQLIGVINERLQAAKASKPVPEETAADATIFLIAFKDRTIEMATSYWVDGFMLHYMTVQGAHAQVRLDHVDRRFSEELNRERRLDFRLP